MIVGIGLGVEDYILDVNECVQTVKGQGRRRCTKVKQALFWSILIAILLDAIFGLDVRVVYIVYIGDVVDSYRSYSTDKKKYGHMIIPRWYLPYFHAT